VAPFLSFEVTVVCHCLLYIAETNEISTSEAW